MKKSMKLGALALASTLSLSLIAIATPSASANTCPRKATVTMLGTIKPEIQDQFLAAVSDYNKSQNCYTVKSVPGDRKLTFLQNVTPMYAAKNAPTIMYTLQEIPDMADKVMDLKTTRIARLVSKDLLATANIGGRQVGVPSTAEAFGLLYNKKVLDKAGVDPSKINTRADLEAAFKKVEASGKKALHFSAIWWSLMFQGNWTEPNLITASKGDDFGIMPLPISNNAKDYGNTQIPVGIPGYFMIDAQQSTTWQRKGAIDFLTWLYTSPAGQKRVAGPVEEGGMNFIPVYKGFKIEPKTYMAKEISKFVVGNKTLDWMNSYYPAGLQEEVGKVSMQQYFTDKISSADLAKAIENAWKGKPKTWRGAAA